MTRQNDVLVLNVALNYGGRWDMVQAAQAVLAAREQPTAETLARHRHEHVALTAAVRAAHDVLGAGVPAGITAPRELFERDAL